MPISIIIPAHNEEAVIERCLGALVRGAEPGELDVIVVCNGCTDRTAELARAFGNPARVIETEVGSKTHALNLGDQAARGFPRLYVDADVQMSCESVRRIADVMEHGSWLAAAPRPTTEFANETSWGVRAYYRFWMALPYVQEGLVAAGIYALSKSGRERFGEFPDIINDDLFVRLHFQRSERIEVRGAVSTVSAPVRFWDLVRIKTRGRLGAYQLWQRFPELSWREATGKQYGRALVMVMRHPELWPSAVPYLLVNLISIWRAARQFRKMDNYKWERDNSSRTSDTCRRAAAGG